MSSEHSLQLLQGGTESAGYHTWLRQEALATIERSELLPLPALATDAAGAAVASTRAATTRVPRDFVHTHTGKANTSPRVDVAQEAINEAAWRKVQFADPPKRQAICDRLCVMVQQDGTKSKPDSKKESTIFRR